MRLDGADTELRADQQRSLAHAADPARGIRYLYGQSHAVVAHRQDHAAISVALKGDDDAASLRVPDDVGQALLGDAVDDQLLLGSQREITREAPLDLEARPLGDHRAERQECALKAELVERLGPKPPRDHPYLLRRLSRTLPQPDDVVTNLLRSAPRQRLATEDQPGEELTDLVVQLSRDAPPLGFLRRQSATCAVAPLALEAVEHRIERFGHRDDLLVAGRGV